jgi:hypothetical protein
MTRQFECKSVSDQMAKPEKKQKNLRRGKEEEEDLK